MVRSSFSSVSSCYLILISVMIFAPVCGQKTLQQCSIGPVIQGAVSRFCYITFTTDIHAQDPLCTYFSDSLQTFQHRIQAHIPWLQFVSASSLQRTSLSTEMYSGSFPHACLQTHTPAPLPFPEASLCSRIPPFPESRFHSGKSFLIRADQDHPFKQWKFHNRIVDPSSAGKQTSECRRLHIRVIVKYKKRERLRYLFQPDPCHIVIVSGINKMDSSGRIRGNTAANGIHRILITVAVGSGNVPGLHPGYFFSPQNC